jgi:hypothetical protein
MAILRGVLLTVILALLAAAPVQRIKRTVTDAEVMSVHRAAILIDTHNDIPSRPLMEWILASPRQ